MPTMYFLDVRLPDDTYRREWFAWKLVRNDRRHSLIQDRGLVLSHAEPELIEGEITYDGSRKEEVEFLLNHYSDPNDPKQIGCRPPSEPS